MSQPVLQNQSTTDALSVVETLRGKTLFVTGVTGFVSKVWVAMVLNHVPQVGRLLLLVRPHKQQNARQRFEQTVWSSPAFRPLREKHKEAFLPFLADKVEVIEGDIRQPRLGLSQEAHAALAQRIDITVHLAGVTEFQADPVHAVAANVTGGMHVADLAARSSSQAFVLVSSAYVAGASDGEVNEALVVDRAPNGTMFRPEEELQEMHAECIRSDAQFSDPLSTLARKARIAVGVGRAQALGWPNIYLYSKGIAEHILAKRQDIKLTIVRPSVVECARNFPFAGWNEGIDTAGPLVWLLSTPYRWIPLRPEHRFDVIPVDTVARGLCTTVALALKTQAPSVTHLTSSEVNPLTFERAIELAGLGLRLYGHRERRALFWQRAWTHLDGIPVDPQTHFEQIQRWKERLKYIESLISYTKYFRGLPAPVFQFLQAGSKRLSNQLRNSARTLGRIEHLLKLYKPFTCDHDYVFRADHITQASLRLSTAERALFGFDIAALDWRDYWLHVEVPGLMKWCTPLLEGKSVPEDPMPVIFETQSKESGRDVMPTINEATL